MLLIRELIAQIFIGLETFLLTKLLKKGYATHSGTGGGAFLRAVAELEDSLCCQNLDLHRVGWFGLVNVYLQFN